MVEPLKKNVTEPFRCPQCGYTDEDDNPEERYTCMLSTCDKKATMARVLDGVIQPVCVVHGDWMKRNGATVKPLTEALNDIF